MLLSRFRNTNIFIILCWLCLLAQLPAQSDRNTAAGRVQKSIDSILATPVLSSGFQGVAIARADTGQYLYKKLATHVFVPASNNKLLTGSAALSILGAGYRYKTVIRSAGEFDRETGIVAGNLEIIGSGDPVLGTTDLIALAKQAASAGVKTVKGAVVCDVTRFDSQPLGSSWEWDDEPYYYAAQISALNVDRNVATVVVTGGRQEGDMPTISVSPLQDIYKIKCAATTAQTSDHKAHLEITRERAANVLVISGKVPPGTSNSPEQITFEKPEEIALRVFTEALQKAGVTVEGGDIANTGKAGVTIVEHMSPPLSQILSLMNKPSDNMIAECLLKTVGAANGGVGTAGAGGSGAQAARKWLLSIGLVGGQLNQVDGSGMARQNAVSPDNLVRLLLYWRKRPEYSVWYNSLPVAGIDGTLKSRMKGTPAYNNCHAKTGSLSQVSCLSGYVTSADGVPLVFSIMTNAQIGSVRPCMAAQNSIVEMLASLKLR